ncbi:MAG: DUF1223 domain-containing protein [Tropicimonas sp.]|uniref:DUF1223 domain-containing protein n=1 Tax=Tropicimonas sp. TaxID=2067044 RepID=UPI003A8B4331
MKVKELIAGLVAACLMSGLAPGAQAEAPAAPVVVELFTSQGCSSCPPADELLNQLAERSDILPLALHVDYWDYIGWADSFARPEHTKRQKAYAHVAGSRTIYTPQMVVGGQEQIIGARPMEVAEAVMRHLRTGTTVLLSLEQRDGELRLTAPALAEAGRYSVQLVRFMPEETVVIERGENAGRTMTYSNIVTDWQMLDEWTGVAPLDMALPAGGEGRAAVIVQQNRIGPIVGALRLP